MRDETTLFCDVCGRSGAVHRKRYGTLCPYCLEQEEQAEADCMDAHDRYMEDQPIQEIGQ